MFVLWFFNWVFAELVNFELFAFATMKINEMAKFDLSLVWLLNMSRSSLSVIVIFHTFIPSTKGHIQEMRSIVS
ncbi:MAG: hypothetical protein CMH57_01920 [Myxococcales bacterium]|nr:hypothetical protein [Myxococcales bacterium]